MGTTAKGYPYPEGTDLVVDGDDAIQALAEAVDLKQPYAMQVTQTNVNGIPASDFKTVTVTLAGGRFNGTVRVTATPIAGFPARFVVSVDSVSSTSFLLNVGNTTTTKRDATIGWHAIQFPAGASALLAEPVLNAIATCPTDGCGNQGLAIEIPTHATDDDGTTRPVDGVECGVCGTDLTDTVQEA